MIGITVSTPKYAALSREAVARWKRFTGLDVLVIECEDREAFLCKMKLDMLAPRELCVFFDADWWALRPLDFTGWQGDAWLAVHDGGVFHPAAFCMGDCERLQLDKTSYFNSGFFAWNNADAGMRRVFGIARQHEHDAFRGEGDEVRDFGEQSRLNLGVQTAGIPLSLLPFGMNCMIHFVRGGVQPCIPRVVHAVHAAGIKTATEKMRHLRAAAELLSYDPEPMQPGALEYHHRLTFDLR